MNKFLWYTYVGIMFTSVEVMMVLFWYMFLYGKGALIIAEPHSGIFLIELTLISLAGIGTIILTYAWSMDKIRIELVTPEVALTSDQKQAIQDNNESIKKMVQDMEGEKKR